jgi:hypothetical protein
MIGKTWACGGIAAMALTMVVAATARADVPPVVDAAIDGVPEVGETLTAVPVITGDPPFTVSYRWTRCDAEQPNRCDNIAEAVAATYVLVAEDLGRRIVLRVAATNAFGEDDDKSAPTEVVVEPEPDPEPAPGTDPTPGVPTDPTPEDPTDPTPGNDTTTSGGQGFVQVGVTPGAAVTPAPPPAAEEPDTPPALRYMEPFPVVRIRGELAERGVRVTLLRVTAGRRADVRVTCRGRGCPVLRLRRGPGRLTAFQRFLPAGMRITIRVTRPNRIGKHVRLRIRDGRPPARVDACILPGTSTPAPCPAR